MVKFDLSVVGQPVEKNANDMLKSPRNPNKGVAKPAKLVAVIRNGMTEQEMKESGDAWANHQGSYMTLAEVFAIENAKHSTQNAK